MLSTLLECIEMFNVQDIQESKIFLLVYLAVYVFHTLEIFTES